MQVMQEHLLAHPSCAMRSSKVIHMVSCHAEGEVGNVIVGGVPVPPGDSLWDQSRWIENDQTLRQFVLNEPRGGVFKHINLNIKLHCIIILMFMF